MTLFLSSNKVVIRSLYRWRDSNSHGSPHTILSRACLPIPPHRRAEILFQDRRLKGFCQCVILQIQSEKRKSRERGGKALYFTFFIVCFKFFCYGDHAMVLGEAPERIVFKTRTPGQHIIPAAQDLAGAEVELIQLENREYRLQGVLHRLRPHYDYIIIDSPPSLGMLAINGLTASDEVVVPVQTEYYALEGLSQLLATIELVRESLRPDLKIRGALLTLYDRRNRLARQVVQEVRAHFPGPVFDSVIPRSVRLAEAPSFGKSILDFDSFSKGARAYKAVAREILERDATEQKEERGE